MEFIQVENSRCGLLMEQKISCGWLGWYEVFGQLSLRSNRASKTGIQLKMFRKQLTKQFRGLSIIHTVEQCEGSNFSSGSQWLNLVKDEVILRKVNDPDSTPLDSIQLWQWGRCCTKPCRAGIFHLWSDNFMYPTGARCKEITIFDQNNHLRLKTRPWGL